MKTEKIIEIEPFWIDDPQPASPSQTVQIFSRIFGIYIRSLILLFHLGFALFVWYVISPYLAVAFIIMMLSGFLLGLYRLRLNKSKAIRITNIQKRARELIAADHIGSAIHVAGQPGLERNQPVVLALKQRELHIYPYDKPNPLVILPVDEIEHIQTVVYDEDRIPHTDVIDTTAQALQITIHHDDHSWQSLFNRMKIMRPIDWYDAIHKAKASRN